MKRSLLSTIAIASIAGLSLTGFSTSAAFGQVPASDAPAVSAQNAAHDISAIRAQFNEYLRTADLDAEQRAHLEAAGASDEVFEAAVKRELNSVLATLHAAGVDDDTAINPDDYQCSATEMDAWVQGQRAAVDPAAWDWYRNGLLGVSPAVFLQYWTLMKTPGDPHDAEFGVDGSKTNEISRTFRALERFWAIDDGDVALVPFDAKVFASTPEAKADRDFVYDGMDEVSWLVSALLQLSVETGINRGFVDEGFPGGVDNPLFTLNAFALDPDSAGDSADLLHELGVTRRVAMGVGLSQMWGELGLGSVGDRAVLSHEYAHHVQYTHGLFETDLTDQSEQTRRSELMADAFATYFAVSKRGASLNKASTLQAMETFYNVGDCSFASSGHHGTPNQRYASAQWAVNFTKAQDNQGHIVPTEVLSAGFDEIFPELIAPDAE